MLNSPRRRLVKTESDLNGSLGQTTLLCLLFKRFVTQHLASDRETN